VRIREKGEEGAVVSLDLPLALVGALGGNGDLEDDQGHGRSKTRRSALGNALRALESGQPIIEIEAEDASVRVFVE
jgi:hypothetical protein